MRKEINLLERYNATTPSKLQRGSRRRRAIPYVLLVIVLALASGWVVYRKAQLTQQVAQLTQQVTDPVLLAASAQATALEAEATGWSLPSAQAEKLNWLVDTYPQVGTETMTVLGSCNQPEMSLKIISYDCGSGLLRFQAATPQVLDTAAYVRALMRTGIFEQVDYSGYAYSSNTGMYSIQVECRLKANIVAADADTAEGGGAQ